MFLLFVTLARRFRSAARSKETGVPVEVFLFDKLCQPHATSVSRSAAQALPLVLLVAVSHSSEVDPSMRRTNSGGCETV